MLHLSTLPAHCSTFLANLLQGWHKLSTLGKIICLLLLLTCTLHIGLNRYIAEQKTQLAHATLEIKQKLFQKNTSQQLIKETASEISKKLFPDITETFNLVSTIRQEVQRNNLNLQRINYRHQHAQMNQLGRYVVSLKIQGESGESIQFMDSMLQSMPTLAVDHYAAKRITPNASKVEVGITFSLFYRLADASGAAQ